MTRRFSRLALIVIAALAALRLAKVGASLTLDEGYMLQHYASQPVSYIRSHYEAPNNHMLLSIILHGVASVWPKQIFVSLGPIWPLQLVSWLCAALSLVLTYLLAVAFLNETTALFAVLALGLSGYPLLYSHMLRGYSLSMALGLLAVWLAYQALERRSLFLAWLLPPVLLAFHYAIPVNVVFTAGFGLWALYAIDRKRRREEARVAAACAAQRAALEAKGPAEKKAAQKLEKLQREAAEKLGAARQAALRLALAAVGLGIAAGALTVWAYLPVLAQMRALGPTPWTWGERLGEAFRVLGATAADRVWFFATAAAGAAYALRRRRFGGAAVLALGCAFFALAASTLQRNVLPARTFLPALPFWAMLFGAGVYAPYVWLRRRTRARWLKPAFCALIAASFLPDAVWYARWHRGMDLRGVMQKLEPWAARDDDFSVVFAYPDWDDIARGWSLADQYYGFAAGMLPYEQSFRYSDLPYMARRRRMFVAQDEAQARAAMAESGVDRFAAAHARVMARVGSFRLYEIDADDALLADDRRAASDASQPADARAEAYAGLGEDALLRGDAREAAGELSQAAALAPQNTRARYLLGYARYLSGDPRAAGDFEWTIAHDTMNAHVRLYDADLLADQGRSQEAAGLYQWYLGSRQLASAWMLGERARAGLAALGAKRGRAVWNVSSPAACLATAAAYAGKGAYEKAELAFEALARLRALSPQELGQQARLELAMRRFARAAQLDEAALAAGGGPDLKFQLAQALAARKDLDKARELVDGLLSAYPNNPQLQSYRDYLAGL